MFRFDMAISYAGEEEGLAYDLYKLLCKNDMKVFFAKPYKVYLFGKHLIPEIKDIFGPYTRFVVPIISKHYAKKYWPKLEFNIAKEEEKHRRFEFILPVIIDDVCFEGFDESDLVYINIRKEGLFSTVDIICQKFYQYYKRMKTSAPKVWVATFGVIIHDILESDKFSLLYAPRDYAHLCNWLEKDLVERLSKSPTQNFKFLKPSHRDGETLSVRICFEWDSQKCPLDFGNIGWWEVLEIAEFEEIYPGQGDIDFLKLGEGK